MTASQQIFRVQPLDIFGSGIAGPHRICVSVSSFLCARASQPNPNSPDPNPILAGGFERRRRRHCAQLAGLISLSRRLRGPNPGQTVKILNFTDVGACSSKWVIKLALSNTGWPVSPNAATRMGWVGGRGSEMIGKSSDVSKRSRQ